MSESGVESMTSKRGAEAASAFGFKEWCSVVDLLGEGRQSIIIRKGGIVEGRNGFQASHERFWLFPTGYHDQAAKLTDPGNARVPERADGEGDVELQYWCALDQAWFVEDWGKVKALAELHYWREETIRERFDYLPKSPGAPSKPGVHVLLVRVYATTPVSLPADNPAFRGCKSWIDIPAALGGGKLVLSDDQFEAVRSQVADMLG